MINPYTPPSTQEDDPSASAATDILLRRIGALALGYLLVRIIWQPLPDLGTSLFGVAIMAACTYGLLRGKKESHLGIALVMAFSISVQTYFVSRAITHPERLPIALGPHPWLDFVLAVVPHTIALVCATALYIRARRVASSGRRAHCSTTPR